MCRCYWIHAIINKLIIIYYIITYSIMYIERVYAIIIVPSPYQVPSYLEWDIRAYLLKGIDRGGRKRIYCMHQHVGFTACTNM